MNWSLIMKFANDEIAATFESYNPEISEKLLTIRAMIFNIAQQHSEIGQIAEDLKWQEPSYLTNSPKSGLTIRLSTTKHSDKYAISVHCQSRLISDFREVYPQLSYDKNRSILLNINDDIPTQLIEQFIYLALTYHYRKKRAF